MCVKIYHYQYIVFFGGQQQHYLYLNLITAHWFLPTRINTWMVLILGAHTGETVTLFKTNTYRGD